MPTCRAFSICRPSFWSLSRTALVRVHKYVFQLLVVVEALLSVQMEYCCTLFVAKSPSNRSHCRNSLDAWGSSSGWDWDTASQFEVPLGGIIIVAAAVRGGVGGAIAVKHTKEKSAAVATTTGVQAASATTSTSSLHPSNTSK